MLRMQGDELLGEQSKMPSRRNRGEDGLVYRALIRLQASPKGTFRLYWDLTSCILILFVALSLPYRVAFLAEWSMPWRVLDLLTDLQFLADVFVNCRTTTVENGEVITSPRATALSYARRGLAFDLLAALPFDWLLNPAGMLIPAADPSRSGIAPVPTYRVVKLLRITSTFRLFRYINKWEVHIEFVNSNVMRLLRLLVVVFCFTHWNGCVQFLAASMDGKYECNGVPRTSRNRFRTHG